MNGRAQVQALGPADPFRAHTKSPMIVRRKSLVAATVVLATLCAAEAAACPICVPYPTVTLADILMECESVVMVREDDERPFVFTPVEVLKGTVDGPVIESFINSTSRRLLRQNPNDLAVFARSTPQEAWRYRAYAKNEGQSFIRAIIEQSPGWNGPRGTDKRIAFFTEHLTASTPLIRTQAYLEVGRAPYAAIKTIAANVPRDQILEFLADWRLTDWHSLFILMLAQSELPADHALIRDRFENSARFRITKNLSAWTTAYIETNPETGFGDVEEQYLARRDRQPAELLEVHRSLSVLGSEGGAVAEPRVARRRRRILESYGILIESHPGLAGAVAQDLTNWNIQALMKELSSILESEGVLEPASRLAVEYYLSMAPRFRTIGH